MTEMVVKVVDASAIGALIFNEPEAAGMAEDFSGARLIAPTLIDFELSSICLKKIQKHPSKTSQLITAFKLAERLSIETVAVDHVEVIELAERTRLTTYDASYLWLAQKAGANLVTLDKRLARAFAK
jgi:predicted nucleic acid-binding protein